jgi:transcriptional regulator with PAS, ATPase and Fis domain
VMESELSPRQRRFVAAMLTARTVREAAATVGVTERTGLKYLANPAVKRALGQALDDALGQATRQVVKAMTGALETLKEIHQDPGAPTGARVSAARAILDAGPKLREALELAERVTALEESLLAGGTK